MAQIVLVSVTSLLIAEIVDKIQAGTGWVAMICFANPNTLSTALIQSETVFVFYHFFGMLLKYADTNRWRDIIISSSMLAIATLARQRLNSIVLFLLLVGYY